MNGKSASAAGGGAAVMVSGGGGPGFRAELIGARMAIGRAPEADIRLDRNTVSRQHAELFRDPFGRWWVRDLNSRNGVRFGDRKYPERVLQAGDSFYVGEFLLTFDAAPAQSLTPSASSMSTIRTSEMDAQIRGLGELETPKIAATHLSTLIDFGKHLLDSDEPAGRLRQLCHLLLRPEFGGRFAMALRAGDGGAADLLCEPVIAADWRRPTNVSSGLVRKVRETRRPALASNCIEGPDVVQMTIAGPTLPSAAVACPLSDSGSDVFYVALPPDRGTAEWLGIASLAVEQFRSAESIWAARRQAQANAAIELELRQASQLQAGLVPAGEIALRGLELHIAFRPCRWVGGDYVGARPLADGRVLLTVADVCGKGLPAALVSSSLHTLLFSATRAGHDLAALMDGINAYLCESLGSDRFVTMASVLIDPASGALQCANAGHPPTVAIHADGTVRQLGSGVNYPLGIGTDPISCKPERLEDGELLVMYTDGLTELRMSDDRLLGIEGLCGEVARMYSASPAAALAELTTAIERRLADLQQGRLADDDQTFLLARRR